jgi:hypothetical protein
MAGKRVFFIEMAAFVGKSCTKWLVVGAFIYVVYGRLQAGCILPETYIKWLQIVGMFDSISGYNLAISGSSIPE